MKKRLLGLVIITIIAVLALVGCDNIIVDIKPEQYTVTFDVDGGSPVAPIKVNENGFVTKPEDPTKEGFDFAGWYKDAARTEAWVFDYHKITGNTTLYAKWVDHVHVGGTATCEDSAVCSVCGESYGTPLGHTPVTDAAVAPTCGKDGLTEGSHCDVCGKVLVAQETVPATGNHAWGEWVTDREATEDADGAKHRDCSVCGAKEEGIIPSLAHQHSYKSEVTTAPGCETKGTMTFTCGCGDSYTEEIPATGHAWNAGEITTAPTCVAPGVKTFTCQNDASHTKTEEIAIDPNAHTLVDVEGKAATCEEDGYTAYKKCSNQGCEHTVGKQTLPALGHKWNEGEVTVPATYGHKGTKTFTCQNDASHTKTEDIEQVKLADNATAAEIVNAAYSLEKGEALIGEFTLTGVITKVDFAYSSSNKNISITIKVTGADESKTIYCYKLVGDDIDKIVAGDTVTITGPIKNYNGKVEFDQGCTLVDYTEHEHQWSEATCKVLATCSICKKTTGEFADHNYGTDGICTVCGHDKNSKEAWVLVTDVAQLKDGSEIVIVSSKYNVAMSTIQRNNNRGSVNVAKDGNTVTINSDVQIIVLGITSDGKYTFFVTGSTNLDGNAVDDGYLYAASSSSNHLKTQKTNDANGTWTIEISESGVATVKAQGSNTRNWLRYNDATSNGQLFSCYSSNQTDISIYVKTTTEAHTCTPADAVKENEVAPTCTAAGSYDEVVYCSECGKEISRNTVTVNSLGHTPVVDAKVDATCESTGLTEGSHCDVCGEILVAQTEIAALGHKWDDGVVTTDPTCEGKGVKTFTCQHDATHTKTEDVAALGHTASEEAVIENKVDATCTVNGSYDSVVYCSVCDDEISRNTVTVPASGHKVGENNTCTVCGANLCGDNHTAVTDAAVAPTCTATGLTEGSHCSKCGHIIVAQEVVDALGHTPVVDAKVDATCTKTGLTEGKHCSVCNEVLVAQTEIAALGHTPVVDAKVDATCTETGLTEGSHCSVCKEVLVAQTEIAALGHTPVVDAKVDATCTETGLTEGSHCSVCKEVLTAQEEVPALGHADENGDYLCDNGCKTLMEPVADSTLTLEEANKLAAAIDSISDSTKYTTNKYYIVGTVKNIANPTYGNPTIVDEDGNEFYSYGMYDTDGETKYEKLEYKPVKGDVVTLYGTIGIYVKNGVASNQMNNGILTNVVPHNHDWSHEATCDNPATCNICGVENVIAHTPNENDLTCSTPIYCTVCREILETEEHVDENENGKCDVCKADVPISAGDRKIVFEFGANGEAEHVDGSDLGESKSYENGEYTLALTEMSKVFGPAYDLKGNSCIKLGTGDVTAKLTFTVPDDVTSVVINIAKYKAKNSKVNINGKEYTLTKSSNDGQYDVITVDTSTTKTITLATIASNSRAMIDSIVFVVPGNEGAKHVHNQATREENRVESTCTVEGHYDLVTYCSDEDCGEEISRTEVKLDTADHSYVPVVTAPTCEAKGYTTHTCSVCGNNYTDTEVAALGHKEETIPAVAPTCTETGLSEGKKCSVCGTVTKEQETVDALGHTEVTDAAVAATCTATGLTEGKHCSVCNEVLEAQTVVDALGHTEVTDAAVAATCTETGLTEGSHCSVCGEVLKAQTVVEKLDHTPGEAVKEDVVESTCTSEGNYELAVYCSVCKKTLSRDYITTPKAEHAKVQHEAKAATCTEIGWNAYETCKNCSYTTYVEIPALEHIDEDNNNVCDREDCKAALWKDDDHIEGEGEVTTKPTCSSVGTRTFKCTACGEILRTEEIDIDENAHNMVKMPGKQKTCTEDGYSTYYLCSLCGLEEDKDVFKAEGHLVNPKVNPVEPTCTEPGKTRGGSCVYCDYEEISEEIPALGHDMTVAVNGQDATCTVDGYNAHTKCSRCDYTEGKVVIPATGHAWDNDCDTTCNNGCGETRVIEHDIVTDAAVAATCTETGLTEGSHCSVCGEVIVAQTVVEINPDAHKWGEGIVTTTATCGTAGVKTYTCQNDATHTKTEETGYNTYNHIYDNGVETTAPTYGHAGVKTFTCTENTSHTYEIEIPMLVLDGDETAAEIVDAAYTLINGETIEKSITLSGVITKVNTEYSSTYKNVTVTIKVTDADETKPIMCFRMKGDGADLVGVGDTITVTGTIKNFEGTIEFDTGCTLDTYTQHTCAWSVATCKEKSTCSICGATTGDYADHIYTNGVCTICGVEDGHEHADTDENLACDTCGLAVIPAAETKISIKLAIALALSREHNNYPEEKYYVTGNINDIYQTTYGNMHIVDDEGNSLTIYGSYNADGSIRYDAMEYKHAVGQTVTVYGVIGNYNGDPQMKNGWVTIVHDHAGAENASCLEANICTICGHVIREALESHTYVDGKCSVCGATESTGGGETTTPSWTKVGLGEIQASDIIVIVWTTSTGKAYAMSSSNGSSSAPEAVIVTVDGEKLSGDIADNIKWNISNENGTLTIHPNGTTATWLYCTANNNGVRVGTNANKAFTIDPTSGYLKNTATSRYVGVYTTNPDIRCYTNTTGNTANQSLSFYKYTDGSSSGDDTPACKHTNTSTATVDATCTVAGSTTVTCDDCGEIVSTTEIPATGHAWDAGVETTAATCTTAGVKTFTCGTCNDTKTEEIAATGHNYVDGSCTACGATESAGDEEGGETPAEPVTASKTVADLIVEYGWTSSTTKQSFNLDDNVTVKINGGSNTGKAYEDNHIRIYATDTPAGTITISVADGYELVSIKITTLTGTYAFLYVDGTTTDISNVETAVSGTSVVLNSVKNGSNGKQVRVTAFEVVYKAV